MKKSTKVLLRIALLLCIAGLVVGFVSWIGLEFDLTMISRINHESNGYDGYETEEEFERIVIETKTADIIVGNMTISMSEKYNVTCYEETRLKHTVTVQDGTLFIKVEDTRKWYDKLIKPREDAEVRVWIPFEKEEFKSIEIKSETGDVTVGYGLQFDKMTIETDTGDVLTVSKVLDELKVKTSDGGININNENRKHWYPEDTDKGEALFVSAETDTGAVYLGDMTCCNLKVKSQTGDVTFKNFEVLEFISVENDTEVVTETLLSGKTFHTETGQDDIPESNVMGTVEIRTDKGKTEIEIIGD